MPNPSHILNPEVSIEHVHTLAACTNDICQIFDVPFIDRNAFNYISDMFAMFDDSKVDVTNLKAVGVANLYIYADFKVYKATNTYNMNDTANAFFADMELGVFDFVVVRPTKALIPSSPTQLQVNEELLQQKLWKMKRVTTSFGCRAVSVVVQG